MIYKIYTNEKGWELLAVKGEVEEIYNLLDYLILEQKKACSYIVIEHNLKENSDFPYAILSGSIEEYLAFRGENTEEKVRIRS